MICLKQRIVILIPIRADDVRVVRYLQRRQSRSEVWNQPRKTAIQATANPGSTKQVYDYSNSALLC